MLVSRFESPVVERTSSQSPLTATAVSVEGRYRLHARVYAAARAEHLGFSPLESAQFGFAPTPWDAPVSRIEVGTGYYVLHNAVGKLVYQHNWRRSLPTGESQGRVAAQLSYWF